jgi:hypothetical protein
LAIEIAALGVLPVVRLRGQYFRPRRRAISHRLAQSDFQSLFSKMVRRK